MMEKTSLRLAFLITLLAILSCFLHGTRSRELTERDLKQLQREQDHRECSGGGGGECQSPADDPPKFSIKDDEYCRGDDDCLFEYCPISGKCKSIYCFQNRCWCELPVQPQLALPCNPPIFDSSNNLKNHHA
ncbi:hypothetical protein ACOSP7_014924 [Xanthoceras sorbifolium]